MKKITFVLLDHLKSDFNPRLYFCLAIFLAAAITVNYSFQFENSIIDAYTGKPIRMVWYFLFYGFAYYAGLSITLFFQRRLTLLRSISVWVFSLSGLMILACSAGFPYHSQLMMYFFSNSPSFGFINSCLFYCQNFVTISLPLLAIARVLKDKNYFGLTERNLDLKPYGILLLFILPLVVMASLDTGFQSYYPTYPSNSLAALLHWPTFAPVAIYEIIYGLDFFNVEFLFRGFMVIGLSKLLGKEAILPMVCVYCFLHFGKPAGEAISSIFGGFALGIVAFRTKNIWGGCIIHIGIAWAMELASYIQHYS